MMGAIITATGTMIPSSSAANAVTMISIQRTLSPYVERLGFPSSADAYDWNDRQPCSAPVVARMRQAAKAPIPVPPCFFVELEPPSKEMLQLLDAISGQPIS
jgi:hypothetical protein